MKSLKRMTWITNQEEIVRAKFSIILFICSILVIFIHTYNLEVYGINENSSGFSQVVFQVESYWAKVTRIAVPMFFMISGILFFRTFEIISLFTKWKKRFFTIIVPYIIWCTLYYIYFVLCTNIPVISSLLNSGTKVELSIKQWFSWLWINEYYTLWFLQNLIVFIILTPIIWLLLNNHYKKIPSGLIFLILFLVIKKYFGIDWPYLSGIEMYLVGSYIGLNCKDMILRKNRGISVISLVYIVATLILSFRSWNFFTEILFYFAIWYVLDLINISLIEIPWWMTITFFTYVAHDVLLEAIEKVFLIVFGTSSYFAIIDYIIMPIAVEMILIIIAYFMRKKLPIVWRLITGGR